MRIVISGATGFLGRHTCRQLAAAGHELLCLSRGGALPAGLPAGAGTVSQGKEVYAAKCAVCHGDNAAGGPMFGSMVGGIGSFKTNTRVLTPGSMYPYAPILFDYVRRAMPLTQPQSLTNDEVYAVSGYILHLNGLLPATATVNAQTLASLRMPNRDGFIVDDRPDTKAQRCMSNCRPL